MINVLEYMEFPTKLMDIEGFSGAHIQKCLKAAKNPQIESKLMNMPVPLSSETIDEYMGSILEAAKTGDFSVIKQASTDK